MRRKKRLPDSILEQLSDARAAAPQSRAFQGKYNGIFVMAEAAGYDGWDIKAQVDEYDRRNPRDPALRPCCRTDPFGGHRGTCLESVMCGGEEGAIWPAGMTGEMP